jgi:hypothetical protein
MHQATGLVAIMLILGAGACLFDAGDDPGEDLCSALVALVAAPAMAFVPPMSGTPMPVVAVAVPLVRPDVPAPPPRA